MRHPLPTSLLSLGLLVAPLAAQTQSPQAQPLLPFLPKGTLMAVSVPDINTSIGEFGQMPLAKMWHEEEVQMFVRDAMDMMQEEMDKAMKMAEAEHDRGAFPVDPKKIMALRVHGGTFAVTQLKLAMGDQGPEPSIGIMAHLDFGPTAGRWKDMIDMGLGMLEQQLGGMVEREDWEVDGTKVITLTPTMAPPGMPMSLNLAMVGNGLLIGTLTDEVRATIEAMNAGTHVLGATTAYKNNAQHLLANGAEAEMFMKPGGFIDFGLDGLAMAAQFNRDLRMIDTEGVSRAIDALGLRGIQSVGVTSSYVDGKCISKSYAVAPAPDRKGLLAGANKTLDTSFLRWVPKDAVSFSATTMEPMSIYDGLVSAMRAYDSDMADQMLGQLGKMEEKIGFSLRDDLFGAVGDSLITWSMPVASMMSPPEIAMLLKVKDADKIVKVLTTLTKMTDGMVDLEENTRRGVKTYQFRINVDPMQGMGANPLDMINLSFSFNEGYMVAGFSPSDIRRVFKRMKRGEDAEPKSDIRGNKEFAAYVGDLPADIQSLSFTDWKANFESIYQIGTSVLSLLPMNEDVPFDMSMLPDSSTMTKHMFGAVSYSQTDGNGMSSTSISPFGPELMLGVVGLVGVGMGVAATMANRF